MQEFQQFLPALFRGLDGLEQRVRDARRHGPAVQYLADGKRPVARGEVAIGTGSFAFPPVDGQAAGGICLNDKQAGERLSQAAASPAVGSADANDDARAKFTSVTDLALHAPDELLNHWRAVAGDDVVPEKFLARFKLIVEDASPDSCFGLICLLLRLGDVDPATVPEEWTKYIEAWERGSSVVGDSAYSAYGPLHNALVHGKFNPDDGNMVGDDIGGAWIDGLRLMLEALASRQPPLALATSLNSPIFTRARALLRFEEQTYENLLEDSTLLQLLVPMAATRNRYRLIDAVITQPALPLGTLKVFLRNDRTRPFLKNGFTLMATFAGGQEEMAISVDPGAGVELADLWKRLEEEEDRRWGPERPSNRPREDIIGYPRGRRADGGPSPNQPWHDGRDYTLIASPRNVTDKDGRLVPGSKLSWSDVLEILWQTYQPFRDAKVLCGTVVVETDEVSSDKFTTLENCSRVILADDLEQTSLSEQRIAFETPRLFVARWCRPDKSSPAFTITPTLCKYLAACIRRWRPVSAAGPVRLAELPDDWGYDSLELPGIVAVVADKGAFLVYDGQRARPPLHEIKTEFERAVAIRRRIERGRVDLEKLLDDIKAYYEGRRKDLIEHDLAERLTTEAVEIALELHKARGVTLSREARQFRQTVLTRWGIESSLDALARDVEQIKNVLYGRAGLATARHLEFLRKYAVPVALAAVFYAICAATVWLWAWTPSGTTLLRFVAGLAVLGLLSLFNFLVLEGFEKHRREKRLKTAPTVSHRSTHPEIPPTAAAMPPDSGGASVQAKPDDRQALREAARFAR